MKSVVCDSVQTLSFTTSLRGSLNVNVVSNGGFSLKCRWKVYVGVTRRGPFSGQDKRLYVNMRDEVDHSG